MFSRPHIPAVLFTPSPESVLAGLTVLNGWPAVVCLAPVAVVTAVCIFKREGYVRGSCRSEAEARKAIKDFIEGR
ncbi:hypothetical protein D3871_27890 [Noviherbaspirillum saxi]|uniref:Uncharacterized protein n=1 Tax=Noviherbaspirillum saxi TaxID=2320863 RepID=A0A3A3FGZ2_9BURK|nr:hypothetical protein D3871_27890 [Noviherbaspirillum saxi]